VVLSEHDIAQIRDSLEAERYAALTARGAAMTYDEIINYTLDETEQSISSLKTA
jgi:hypothetical protein